MGLISPVDLPTPAELGPVHFIAIGGSGMNGIAAMLLDSGVPVSGSDRQDSKYLRALEAAGARVYVGHRAEQLDRAETVVASSAIREDNPELAEARRRGLRVLHRSAALGSLMLGRRGIAVAGTHGKTTTTAMIAHVLTGCGYDPSFVIGGALTGSATGGHLGAGEVMVVEADESDGSFLQYPAEVAVVTNVDPDHLSNWGTAENYADGFLAFATGDQVRLVVISADDPGAVALTQRIAAEDADVEVITFGVAPAGGCADRRPDSGRFRVDLRAAAERPGRPGRAHGPRALQHAERGRGVRGDDLAGRRRGAGAPGAVGVPGDLSPLPAGRHRQRRAGLRRLRPPSDRGTQHAGGRTDRGRRWTGGGLLPAPPLHPYSGLLAPAGRGAGAGRPGRRDGRLWRPGGPDCPASTARWWPRPSGRVRRR